MVHAVVMRRDAVLIYGNYRAGQRSRCLYRRPTTSNCGSIDLCREADAPVFYGRGVHELADRGEHRGDGLVVVLILASEFIESRADRATPR